MAEAAGAGELAEGIVAEEELLAVVAEGAEVPGTGGVTVWMTKQDELRESERAATTNFGEKIFTQLSSFEYKWPYLRSKSADTKPMNVLNGSPFIS